MIENKTEKFNDLLIKNGFDFSKAYYYRLEKSELDSFDLLFAILFGTLGTYISTDEEIKKWLDDVHTLSNGRTIDDNPDSIQMFLAKLLHHSGDYIDSSFGNVIVAGDVLSRDEVLLGGPHRVLFGHDIFQLDGTNPFALCIEQYGFTKGILQAIAHLVADTFSKQGLPIPGHSFFDYVYKDEKGTHIGNYLLDICQRISKESFGVMQKTFNNEVLNRMFSLQAQDIGSKGLAKALCDIYFAARGIQSEDRKIQMRIICYAVLFYATCMIGWAKTGVLCINWPALLTLTVEIISCARLDKKDTQVLESITRQIVDTDEEFKILAEMDLDVAIHPFDKKTSMRLISILGE